MDLKVINKLRQDRADALRALEGLLGKETYTEAEEKEASELEAKILGLDRRIGQVKTAMDLERAAEAVHDPEREAQEQEDDALRATTGIEASQDKPKKVPNLFPSFGHFLQAVKSAEVTNGRSIDPKLTMMNRMHAAASGLNESIPSEGGFAVGTDTNQEIWKRTYNQGALLNLVRRLPVGPASDGLRLNAIDEGSRADGSRWGGIQAFWADEADQFTGTKPKFREIELKLDKLTAICYATNELLKDSVALEGLIMELLPQELIFKAEDAVVNGDGVGKPQGFLKSGAVVAAPLEAAQAGTKTIVANNILKMYTRMPAMSRSRGVWLINQEIEPQLWGMFIPNTNLAMFFPPGGMVNAPSGILMGRPIIPVEYCAPLGTQGDIIFLDPSAYLMIDKGGIESASSMHVRFINDENTYRFLYRLDGKSLWDKPLTPKNANAGYTLSPFVTLTTNH